MTATRVSSVRVKRACREKDYEIASMDDEAKIWARCSTTSASVRLSSAALSQRYQIVVVGVTDPEYLAWAKEGLFVTLDGVEAKDARSIAGAIGVAKTMRKYCLYRGITFHTKVDSALKVSHLLPEVVAWMPRASGPRETCGAHASGKMTAGVRAQLLDQLRDLYDTSVVCPTHGASLRASTSLSLTSSRSWTRNGPRSISGGPSVVPSVPRTARALPPSSSRSSSMIKRLGKIPRLP